MAAEKSGTTTEKATSKKAADSSTSEEGTSKKATSAKKTTRKSSSASNGRRGSDAPRAAARRPKVTAASVAEAAGEQLAQLAGKEVEGVTGIERTDDGWKVQVEVLELRRVPSTTDVLAVYEVTMDEDGDLEGYRRHERYVRGVPGEGGR
jgi:hypothetical protein